MIGFPNLRMGGLAPLFARPRTDFGSVIVMSPDHDAAALFAELRQRFRQRSFQDRLHAAEPIHRLLIAFHRESHGAHLRRLPLGQARVMLAASAAPDVETVARSCGDASANTFCRAFRLKFGRSPCASC